jgi:NAD(P)-dependent dehydrogenase (short-subunit alcohol dehydrogenase family)
MPVQPQIDLDGRVALVTGGARGIGFGIAQRLHAAGARVALASRTQSDLERARDQLGGGDGVRIHRCDVSSPANAAQLVRSVVDELGRLDVLVCSHGVYLSTRSLFDITPDEYDETMAINVRGTFFCAQAAARAMVDQGDGGRIIMISSMNAIASLDGAVDYDTSKAAMHGLTRAMAIELAPHGITVNAIAPGWIRTEMSVGELEDLRGMVMNPSSKVGEPADVARAALWLADPDNSFMTGGVVVLDGGQTAMLPLPWPADRGTALIP